MRLDSAWSWSLGGPRSYVRAAAVVVLAALAPRVSTAAIQFDSAYQPIPSGPGTSRLVALDIDGDGRTDLIVSGSTNQILVHRGLPGGGFAPATVLLSFPGNVGAFDVGDINGDGKTDFVVADGTRTAWSVLGNGNGTFQAPRAFLTSFFGACIKLGDLDRDGRLDLVASTTYGPIYTMRGLGDGGFQLVSIAPQPPQLAISLAIADFDGDSIPDVLAGDLVDDAVYFFHGLPGLNLAAPVAIPGMPWPAFIVTADLNEDGLADAMICSQNSAVVSILYGTRGGPPGGRTDLTNLPMPADVKTLDLDGDGHLDLAVACAGENVNAIVLFKRDATGAFQRVRDFAAGLAPGQFAFVDANADGRLDAVVVNRSTSRLAIVHGHAGMAFGDDEEVASVPFVWDLVVGDLDRDRHPDVATMSQTMGGLLGVHLGVGDGTFGTMIPTAGPGDFQQTYCALGDVNGDGVPDVVGTIQFYDQVQAVLGDGAGHFTPTPLVALASEPWFITLADFNEDGKADAAVGTDTGLAVLLGTASGSFGPPALIAGQQKFVTSADLDHDGHMDLIATNSYRWGDWGSQVSIFKGHGDGTFTALPTVYAGYKPIIVAVRDLTGDGIPDLVVANDGEATMTGWRGVGDGTFVSLLSLTGIKASDVALADFDGDGAVDIAAAIPALAGINVWPGLGGGGFGSPVFFGTRCNPDMLRIADLNGDGLPDLVVGHLGQNEFDVLLNRSVSLPVPTRVSLVEARADGSHVRIEWFSDSRAMFAARVQRSGGGVWDDAGPVRSIRADYVSFEEDVPDGEYDYRLLVPEGTQSTPMGLAHVSVRTPRVLALSRGEWDATAGAFRMTFSLPGGGPARVQIVDLAGRQIAQGTSSNSGAGSHTMLLGAESRITSGIYWARLTQAGSSVARRIAVVR